MAEGGKTPALEAEIKLRCTLEVESELEVKPTLKDEPSLEDEPALKRKRELEGETALKCEPELEAELSLKREPDLEADRSFQRDSKLEAEPSFQREHELEAEPSSRREPDLETEPSSKTESKKSAAELLLESNRAMEADFQFKNRLNYLRGELKQIISEVDSTTKLLSEYKSAQRANGHGNDSGDEPDDLYYDPDFDFDLESLRRHRELYNVRLETLKSKLSDERQAQDARDAANSPAHGARLRAFAEEKEDSTFGS